MFKENKDPYAVEELNNEASDNYSKYRIRKSFKASGDIAVDKKKVAEIYQILLFWVTDKGMRESRILMKVILETKDCAVFANVEFGNIQGMDLTTKGGH